MYKITRLQDCKWLIAKKPVQLHDCKGASTILKLSKEKADMVPKL